MGAIKGGRGRKTGGLVKIKFEVGNCKKGGLITVTEKSALSIWLHYFKQG